MAMTSNWMVQSLRSILSDFNNGHNTINSLDVADGYKWRIELIYRDLLAKQILYGLDDCEEEALAHLGLAYLSISTFIDSLSSSCLPTSAAFPAQIILRGNVGRPLFDISFRQLEYLLDNRFTVPQISKILDVSISTIRRRMSTYNLSVSATYSLLTDEELDAIVIDKQREFPNWGNRQLYGYLISQGIRVQFHRVRESQSRVDPEGSIMRRLHNLRRRTYSVPGPQHLWHIDGNHKLIR